MHPLYVLQPPIGPPEPPERWSYSDLAQWEKCPRRWWLLRACYPAWPGGEMRLGYPEKYGPAALRGRLVHAALEAYRNSLRGQTSEPFQARAFLKQWLRAWQTKERENNPRIDIEALRARLSLDECMAEFRALASHVPVATGKGGSAQGAKTAGQPRPPKDAAEYWLGVDNPPLKGRIDRVRQGRLIDFKTGAIEEEHREQLRFYALLWWLKFGEAPAGLAILYTDVSRADEVPVPSPAEMTQLAQDYRQEVQKLQAVLKSPPVPAHPSAETCTACPVRQLCEDYWSAPATKTLRAPEGDEDGAVSYCDIQLTRLPTRRLSGPLVGEAEAVGLGTVSILIERGKCPPLGNGPPLAAFLLGARVEKSAGRWEVRVSLSGEVFWKLGHSE
jgi:hypothetical protein